MQAVAPAWSTDVVPRAARKITAAAAKLPAVVSPAASSPQLGFMDGADGQMRHVWARRFGSPANAIMPGLMDGMSTMLGGRAGREGRLAAGVADEMATSNPLMASVIEALMTHTVGTGLKRTVRIDAEALGITPDQARDLNRRLEKMWTAYAADARECDLAGRSTLHELARQFFRSYLIAGEGLALIDWKLFPGNATATKVSLLASTQLDFSKSGTVDGSGSVVQGVEFTRDGRVVAYWIRPFNPGAIYQQSMPIRVPAATSWGRQRVCHRFEVLQAGQVRGLSPLTPALTAAFEKASLQEATLVKSLVETAFVMFMTSQNPTEVAAGGLGMDEPRGASPADVMAARAEVYGAGEGVKPNFGTIAHLLPGDEIKAAESKTPGGHYDPFDKSLAREVAKASGSSYEDASGDFSKTSFSASRLAIELPYRIAQIRRANIVERFYQAVFESWIEETLETGRVELPKGCPSFWQNRSAFTGGKWLGAGRVTPDPYKATQADVLAMENGLVSWADAAADRGYDLEELAETLKHEAQLRIECGLIGPGATPGAVTTQHRDVTDEEDDK